MGVTEIILLILGGLVFTLSFLIPAGAKKRTEDVSQISEEQIKELIDKEVAEAKNQIGDIVDETITYSMEKTERAMERLTNEKIMAVNEYSDTVLEQINKNHKEAVFLYDMLNDKHENLKKTVSEAVKTATEVKQTVKDAEVTAKEAEELAREVQESLTQTGQEENKPVPAAKETVASEKESVPEPKKETILEEIEFTPIQPQRVEIITPQSEQEEKPKKRASKKTKTEEAEVAEKPSKAVKEVKTAKETNAVKAVKADVSLDAMGSANGKSNKERILELHQAGKSNMAIAKELGLGIGEVKLVIDLFKGI